MAFNRVGPMSKSFEPWATKPAVMRMSDIRHMHRLRKMSHRIGCLILELMSKTPAGEAQAGCQ